MAPQPTAYGNGRSHGKSLAVDRHGFLRRKDRQNGRIAAFQTDRTTQELGSIGLRETSAYAIAPRRPSPKARKRSPPPSSDSPEVQAQKDHANRKLQKRDHDWYASNAYRNFFPDAPTGPTSMRSNSSQVIETRQEPSIPVSVNAENDRNGSRSAYQERSAPEDPRVMTPPLNPTLSSNSTRGWTSNGDRGRPVASTTSLQLKNPPSLPSSPQTGAGKEPTTSQQHEPEPSSEHKPTMVERLSQLSRSQNSVNAAPQASNHHSAGHNHSLDHSIPQFDRARTNPGGFDLDGSASDNEPMANQGLAPPTTMQPRTNMQSYPTSVSALPPQQTGNPWIARIAELERTNRSYREAALARREERADWREERAELIAQLAEMGRREGQLEERLESREREIEMLKILFHQFQTLDKVLKANEAEAGADKENDEPAVGEAEGHV